MEELGGATPNVQSSGGETAACGGIPIELNGGELSQLRGCPPDTPQHFLGLLFADGSAHVHSLTDEESTPLELHVKENQVYRVGFLVIGQDSLLSSESIVVALLVSETSTEMSVYQQKSDGQWENLALAFEVSDKSIESQVLHSNENSKNPKFTLLQQNIHPSFLSFSKDCFCTCSADLSSIWIWRVIKLGETWKVKQLYSITLKATIFSVLLTPTHLIVGESGGIRFWSLENLRTRRPKDPEGSILEFGQSVATSPVKQLEYVVNTCILAKTSHDEFSLFAFHLESSPPKLVQLKFPFSSIDKFAVLTQFATRSEAVTISGDIFFSTNPYSLYAASFKDVLKALESPREERQIEVKPRQALLCTFPIHHITAVRPDTLFVGSQSSLMLYLFQKK